MPNLFLDPTDSDYVYIEDSFEYVEGVTKSTQMTALSTIQPSKDLSHLRLNPTQLNNLNLSHLISFAVENQYNIENGFVDTGNINIKTYFKHLTKDQQLDFFVFQAVCDVERSDKIQINNNNLAFINDVIKGFKKKYPKSNGKLLIPLNQSRGSKRHSVLVEVTLGEKIEEITLHNSQSKWGELFYPNCLNDLSDVRINKQCYQMQKDDISCGFFVHFYIKSILKNKNSNQLNEIYVTLKALISNPSLLEDILNENFVKIYPDARKITASGANLPWDEALMKELDKSNFKKLGTLNVDFPGEDDYENSASDIKDQKMTYSR